MVFTKGDKDINRAGRHKGSRDFYTDFKKAIKHVSDKETGESVDEVYIIKKGIEKMINGQSHMFREMYKDVLDRVYGKAIQKSEITGEDGSPLLMIIDDTNTKT